jgi:cyanate permease
MEQERDGFRWVVLALLFGIMSMSFLAVNCMPPLFTEILEQIPLTKAQMGTIMGVVTLASLFFAPVGGALGDRFGPRWVLGLAILIMASGGVLRATAGSAFTLTLYMFVFGAGVAIFGPNLPKALSMWFPKNQLAMANGIAMAGMGVGGAVGMGMAASVMSPLFGGWRGTMVWVGIGTFALGLLWVFIFRERRSAEEAAGEHNMLGNFRSVFKVRDIWLLAIFYGLNMAGLMLVITLLPITLTERGVEHSGELVAILMGTAVVFNIVGGILSDKTGKRKPFLIISALVLGICIMIFAKATGLPLIIALALAGAAMGTVAPVMMAMPVEIEEVGPALTATAVGLIFMLGNTGGAIGPIVGGKLIDSYGYVAGFFTMAAALIIAAFFIIPMRETGKKKHASIKPLE